MYLIQYKVALATGRWQQGIGFSGYETYSNDRFARVHDYQTIAPQYAQAKCPKYLLLKQEYINKVK